MLIMKWSDLMRDARVKEAKELAKGRPEVLKGRLIQHGFAPETAKMIARAIT